MNKNSMQSYVTKADLYEFGDVLTKTILAGVQRMYDKHEVRLNGIDKRLDKLEAKFDKLDAKFDILDNRVDNHFEYFDKRIDNLTEAVTYIKKQFGHRLSRLETKVDRISANGLLLADR